MQYSMHVLLLTCLCNTVLALSSIYTLLWFYCTNKGHEYENYTPSPRYLNMDKYLSAAQQTSLTLARPAHTAGMTYDRVRSVYT